MQLEKKYAIKIYGILLASMEKKTKRQEICSSMGKKLKWGPNYVPKFNLPKTKIKAKIEKAIRACL